MSGNVSRGEAHSYARNARTARPQPRTGSSLASARQRWPACSCPGTGRPAYGHSISVSGWGASYSLLASFLFMVCASLAFLRRSLGITAGASAGIMLTAGTGVIIVLARLAALPTGRSAAARRSATARWPACGSHSPSGSRRCPAASW